MLGRLSKRSFNEVLVLAANNARVHDPDLFSASPPHSPPQVPFPRPAGPAELSVQRLGGETLSESKEVSVQTTKDDSGPLRTLDTESDISECSDVDEPQVPLREMFRIAGIPVNLLHGSESAEQALREIGFFWPLARTNAVEKMITEAGLVIAARKTVELSKEEVAMIYCEKVEEEFFPQLEAHMMR